MPSGCLNSEAPLGGWFFHGRRRSCELCKEHSEACRRLVALFAIQSLGTARIGHAFGPVMAVWLITIALSGIWGITKYPAVLLSFDPGYALSYLVHGGFKGFAVLGGVFLCVTGAEALYADMGHFGPRPIRIAWSVVGSARRVGARRAPATRRGHYNKKIALLIAIMALFLAFSGMLGKSANTEALNLNILASDTWAFFQARTIRRTTLSTAIEVMTMDAGGLPSLHIKASTHLTSSLNPMC